MYRKKHSRGHIHPGLTLIELLVVISVVAILASILLVAVGNIANKRDSVKCITNLRQLGAASILYAADNDGKLPIMHGYYSDRQSMEFWYLELRTYLGARDKRLSYAASYPSGRNLDVFYCPSVEYGKAYPHTQYGANPYVFLWPSSADQLLENSVAAIPEPSRTIMFSENQNPGSTLYNGTWQTSPAGAKASPDTYLPSNRHGGYVNMVFVDGHTESVEFRKLKDDTERYFGKAPFN